MLLIALLLASAEVGSPSSLPPQQLGGERAWQSAATPYGCGRSAMVCAQWALQDGRPDASVAILTKAAREDRDPEAMRAVGVMLATGELLAKDSEAAIGWFYEAALRGDRPAMRLLADAFRTGTGVATDAKLADYWAKRANR